MSKSTILKPTTVTFGIISFLCLITFYMALTDIWHKNGSFDFWDGEGICAFEWTLLAYCFVPLFIFHILFFIMMARKNSQTD